MAANELGDKSYCLHSLGGATCAAAVAPGADAVAPGAAIGVGAAAGEN